MKLLTSPTYLFSYSAPCTYWRVLYDSVVRSRGGLFTLHYRWGCMTISEEVLCLCSNSVPESLDVHKPFIILSRHTTTCMTVYLYRHESCVHGQGCHYERNPYPSSHFNCLRCCQRPLPTCYSGPIPHELIRLPATSLGSGICCCTEDLTTTRRTASRV